MKRFSMASVTLAVLVLPTVALASVSTAHRVQYLRLYHTDQRMHGQRDPGCKLVGPKETCHVRTTDAMVVRSIGVLQRAIAPPPSPVTATAGAEATNARMYTPQARTVSPSYAPTRTYTIRRTYTAPVQHYSAPSSYSSGGGCGGNTPYSGGGQCWAIPYSIVSCESGGQNISNHQGSGANGYYQLMSGGGGSRSSQDAAAAALWAGGKGAGNWVCK